MREGQLCPLETGQCRKVPLPLQGFCANIGTVRPEEDLFSKCLSGLIIRVCFRTRLLEKHTILGSLSLGRVGMCEGINSQLDHHPWLLPA